MRDNIDCTVNSYIIVTSARILPFLRILREVATNYVNKLLLYMLAIGTLIAIYAANNLWI